VILLKKIIKKITGVKTQRIAGIIVFRHTASGIKYLLLDHHKSGWGFSKGKLERGEAIQKGARRELFEETGLKNVEFIPDFSEKIEYIIRKKDKTRLKKIAQYFLVKTKKKKIILSEEHEDYQWVDYKEALRILPYKNLILLIKKADKIINTNIKRKK
jgi:bis(5'-nucleosidyl)-tetraphosphatase